jgi:carbonic anhydrase
MEGYAGLGILLLFGPTLYRRLMATKEKGPEESAMHTVKSLEDLQKHWENIDHDELDVHSPHTTKNYIMKSFLNENSEIAREQEEALEEFKEIYLNNKRFVRDALKSDPDFFLKRSKVQTPKYLFIGCSDSRVPAEAITGLKPGELFVQRNIANLVVNTDINILSVIQYAVCVLKVKHVIICGHYGCGGVERSMENNDLGLIENWLRNIRDIQRLHADELEKMELEDRKRRLVELNVQEQCFNIAKVSFVQHAIRGTGFPLIHGLVYELGEGILKKVELDFEGKQKKFDKIYQLNL